MSLMAVTKDTLTRQLDREVPELYVIIAKHSVLGMDDDGIREIIGCTAQDLSDVLNDPFYREIRIMLGAIHANSAVDQTTGWDRIEELAITNLVRRMEMPNQDPEFALRVAAVANKAQRRASAGKDQGVLDATHQKTAKISLTSRLVQSFARDGETRVHERILSIEDGSMAQASFDEVDGLLAINAVPALPQKIEISTTTPKVTMDELDADMERRENG
jgi:hypothetical protein